MKNYKVLLPLKNIVVLRVCKPCETNLSDITLTVWRKQVARITKLTYLNVTADCITCVFLIVVKGTHGCHARTDSHYVNLAYLTLLCVDYPHCNSLPSLSSLAFLRQTTLARTREARSEDIEKKKLLITGMGWSTQVCKKSKNVQFGKLCVSSNGRARRMVSCATHHNIVRFSRVHFRELSSIFRVTKRLWDARGKSQ